MKRTCAPLIISTSAKCSFRFPTVSLPLSKLSVPHSCPRCRFLRLSIQLLRFCLCNIIFIMKNFVFFICVYPRIKILLISHDYLRLIFLQPVFKLEHIRRKLDRCHKLSEPRLSVFIRSLEKFHYLPAVNKFVYRIIFVVHYTCKSFGKYFS